MNLKVLYVSFINLLVALVVNSTNAHSNPNEKYLDLAKQSYINQNYARGDFYIARYLFRLSILDTGLHTLQFFWMHP